MKMNMMRVIRRRPRHCDDMMRGHHDALQLALQWLSSSNCECGHGRNIVVASCAPTSRHPHLLAPKPPTPPTPLCRCSAAATEAATPPQCLSCCYHAVTMLLPCCCCCCSHAAPMLIPYCTDDTAARGMQPTSSTSPPPPPTPTSPNMEARGALGAQVGQSPRRPGG